MQQNNTPPGVASPAVPVSSEDAFLSNYGDQMVLALPGTEPLAFNVRRITAIDSRTIHQDIMGQASLLARWNNVLEEARTRHAALKRQLKVREGATEVAVRDRLAASAKDGGPKVTEGAVKAAMENDGDLAVIQVAVEDAESQTRRIDGLVAAIRERGMMLTNLTKLVHTEQQQRDNVTPPHLRGAQQ